jgi:hypothetical protein
MVRMLALISVATACGVAAVLGSVIQDDASAQSDEELIRWLRMGGTAEAAARELDRRHRALVAKVASTFKEVKKKDAQAAARCLWLLGQLSGEEAALILAANLDFNESPEPASGGIQELIRWAESAPAVVAAYQLGSSVVHPILDHVAHHDVSKEYLTRAKSILMTIEGAKLRETVARFRESLREREQLSRMDSFVEFLGPK